ncbi:putative replicative DNA helicase [Erwinia phage vB_EamM_Yoloswag]|uniref:Putative replicative DNA helicase n=1 Tax=Erwinia phage vB_EamM_Yoloswag TaxID=1958956 RepID=A0A1S6L2S6_9CAUD|nr:DnaB-like replicative helicase [Erwinia phage vB_EamM_Yoloswag]AQT28488.1 putative replicative DNA helicase [Erwinia phage vB_EamM_Yoloswag]
MLGRLGVHHFSSEVTRKAYRRLNKLLEVKGELLDWEDLLEDPNLGEEFRDELRASEEKPAKSKQGFDRIFDGLEKYRKRRQIMMLGKQIAKDLDSDEEEFDEDEYLQTVADQLNQASKGSNITEKVWTFGGKKGNAVKLAKQTIHNPQELMYKTGFKVYDTKNGGWPTTGVVLLAGSTSGGKSVMSMNLADNIAQLNSIHCLKVTLEMTAEQEMNRMLSMISGVPFWKIKQKKLSDREKKKLLAAAKEYDKKLRKSKGKNSFVSPERGMSIEDVLYMTVPYNVQVSFIDYVGLLEGIDNDNQWRELSTIVRKAKVHASRTGQLVVILCQLDDQSGRIRYSGGMREHADVVWAWNYSDPEIRETKIIPVQVMKARDGELFEMPLRDLFEYMQVKDADEGTEIPRAAASALEDDSGEKKFKKGKGGFKKKDVDKIPLKKNRRSATDFLKGNDRDGDDDDDDIMPKKKKKKYAVVS